MGLKKDSVYAAIGAGSSEAAALALSMVVAHARGVADLGRLSYALWMTSLLVTFGGLGVPLTVQRTAARFLHPNKLAEGRKLCCWLGGIAAISVCVCAAAVGPSISRQTGVSLALLGAAGLSLLLYNVLFNWLIGLHRFVAGAAVRSAVAGTQIAGAAFAVHLSDWRAFFGVIAVSQAFGLGLAAALLNRDVWKVGASLGKDTSREAAKLACAVWLSSVVSFLLWQRGELFFLKAYRSPNELGLFSAAALLAAVPVQASLMLTGALVPHFARAYGSNDIAYVARAYSASCYYVALIVLLSCAGLAVLGQDILRLCYGSAFSSGTVPLWIMLASSALLALSGTSSSAVYASGRALIIPASGIVGVVVLVFCGVILVPAFGVVGAALGRLVTTFVTVGIGFCYVQFAMKLRFPWGKVGRLAISAAVSSLAGFAARRAVPTNGGVIVAGCAILLCYGILLATTRRLHMEGAVRG